MRCISSGICPTRVVMIFMMLSSVCCVSPRLSSASKMSSDVDADKKNLIDLYSTSSLPVKARIREIVKISNARTGRNKPMMHQMFFGTPKWYEFLDPIVDHTLRGGIELRYSQVRCDFLEKWYILQLDNAFARKLHQINIMKDGTYIERRSLTASQQSEILKALDGLLEQLE